MPKKHRCTRLANPDFRQRSNPPLPSVAEIEKQLRARLTPNVCAAARREFSELGWRQRVLTLPVRVPLGLSLVWRRLPSLSELLRVLCHEGVLDLEPMPVSKQALSQSLQASPATLFAPLVSEALQPRHGAGEVAVAVPESWRSVPQELTAVLAVDGSTLDALRRQLKELKAEVETPLAGKLLVVLGWFTQQFKAILDERAARANEKRFSKWFCEQLAEGSVTVFDCGFFSFKVCDRFSDERKYLITRMREKTVYKVAAVLGRGPGDRDEIIEMGQRGSAPPRHQVRLVSVWWHGLWHRSLTNVLDESKLSARQVCEVYRRRWRIADAVLLTQRLLGLSYLWVGSQNGVELQLQATWLCSAVLTR